MKQITCRSIEELAGEFDQIVNDYLPVWILPNGALYYDNCMIKELNNSNWGVFNAANHDLIGEYYTKSCALVAAQSYRSINMVKFALISRLDRQYWSCHVDLLLYRSKLLKEKVYDDYLLLLDKLENASLAKTAHAQSISKLFVRTFVEKT